MSKKGLLNRESFISVVAFALVVFVPLYGFCSSTKGPSQAAPPAPKGLISPQEAYRWHLIKDSFGPTFSGSRGWRKFLKFLENQLLASGVVDITKNSWTYNRWHTSEWPDSNRWTLNVDGRHINVAHYGAYSGSTEPQGVTAKLLLYKPDTAAQQLEGKIVVFRLAPHPKPPFGEKYKKWFTLNDYEYRSDSDSFPPLFTAVSPSVTVSFDVWWQLRQTIKIAKILAKGRAAGGVVIFNMGYDRLAGLYTFPVLPPYGVPTLYIDRKEGRKVIRAARKGKEATLRLIAKTEPTTTYQLIGYLPGRRYGTQRDRKIILITHTDGPSISQENGALGLLGVVRSISRIPRQSRPRTLMIYLDNRHYMPGMERAFSKEDFLSKHPGLRKSIVGLIAMEHLGQLEFKEVGDDFVPTGRVEPSFLWTRNDQRLIETAIKVVKETRWPRVMVQCVERPGIHGGPQGIWYGMGKVALKWDLPAFATMGTQGAYWATTARIDKFDRDLFSVQVDAMTRLTWALMNAGGR